MIDRRVLMAGMGATGLIATLGMPARSAPRRPFAETLDTDDPRTALLVFDDDAFADEARQDLAQRGICILEEADLREVGVSMSSVMDADTVWMACASEDPSQWGHILRLCDQSVWRSRACA